MPLIDALNREKRTDVNRERLRKIFWPELNEREHQDWQVRHELSSNKVPPLSTDTQLGAVS